MFEWLENHYQFGAVAIVALLYSPNTTTFLAIAVLAIVGMVLSRRAR